MKTNTMATFIEDINPKVIALEVKDVMLKSNSFNRVFVTAFEKVAKTSYSVDAFETLLSTVAPMKLVDAMEFNGFSLIMENGTIRFTHVDEVEDEMTHYDVAMYLLDELELIFQ